MIFGIIHIIVLVSIIGSAFMALNFKDLLSSVISLGVMSLLLSLEFYLLEAPDVAIAESAIGAGLTTVIYVITIKRTYRWEHEKID
jgi:energy-converting hydrogenase B subunit D